MRVRDARAVATRWVIHHAARAPDFAGAFLSGSSAWLPGDAGLPASSDVDIMIVTTDAQAPAKLGKFLQDGVLLEASCLSWDEIPSAEAVLATYYLAGSFRRNANSVIADPTGRLTALHSAVAGEYAKRPWVRLRCESAERRITDGLAQRRPRTGHPQPDQPCQPPARA